MKRALLALLLLASPAMAQVIGPDGSWGVFVPDRSTSATLGALNAAATLQFTGRQGVGCQITTANLSATVIPEVSFDGGSTWLASSFVTIGGTSSSSIVFSGGADTQQRAIVVVGGVSHVRVRVSAYVSGTSTAVVRNTTASSVLLSVGGSVSVTQGTSPWVVSGTVAATQSGTWVLGANSGVDIGDVTINNAAGASAVNIQDGGNSITVDGTLTTTPPANATTNVTQFGGTNVSTGTGNGGAGMPRVTVSDDSSITNISGTISLPTGAATEATLAKLPLAQASATSGQSGPLVQGAVTTAAPSYTNGQTSPLSLTTAGALRVDTGSAGGGTSSSFGAAFPASGTAAGYNDGTNMQGAMVYDVDTGAGTDYAAGATLRIGASGGSIPVTAGAGATAAGTLRVVLPTDQTVIPVSDNAGSLTVDNPILSIVGGGTEAAAQRVTIANDSTGVLAVNTELPAAVALADNTSNPTVPGVGAFLMAWDGAQWDRVGIGSSSGLRIENPSPNLVRVGIGVTGVSDDPARLEDQAFTAADALMVAGSQRADTPATDTTTDGDLQPLKGDSQGRLWTNPHGPVTTAVNDGSCATVNGTASTVIASSSTRRGFVLLAAPANTATIFVKMGTTATVSDFPLAPGSAFNMLGPLVYTGDVSAITALASLSLCVWVF